MCVFIEDVNGEMIFIDDDGDLSLEDLESRINTSGEEDYEDEYGDCEN